MWSYRGSCPGWFLSRFPQPVGNRCMVAGGGGQPVPRSRFQPCDVKKSSEVRLQSVYSPLHKAVRHVMLQVCQEEA